MTSLGNVEKRMAHFEDLISKWEAAQYAGCEALEHISNRQAMIDAVRSQIGHVVELTERASDNVRCDR